MRIAPDTTSPAAGPVDVTTLLSSREAVLDRLVAQLPALDTAPATLLIIGLLRRDDGLPASQAALAHVTTLLARSVRGDDWLASSGPAEFAVVLTGPVAAAETAATRLVAGIAALGIPGISAAAGIAPLTTDVAAEEVLHQATLSLTAARRVGAGTVIRYREPC